MNERTDSGDTTDPDQTSPEPESELPTTSDEESFEYDSDEVAAPEPGQTEVEAETTTEKEPTPPVTRAVDDRPVIPIGLILALAVSVLLVLFAIQNTQPVELNFFDWSWEAPLILALIGAFVAAVIIDETLGLWMRQRRRKRRETREELEHLRRQSSRD